MTSLWLFPSSLLFFLPSSRGCYLRFSLDDTVYLLSFSSWVVIRSLISMLWLDALFMLMWIVQQCSVVVFQKHSFWHVSWCSGMYSLLSIRIWNRPVESLKLMLVTSFERCLIRTEILLKLRERNNSIWLISLVYQSHLWMRSLLARILAMSWPGTSLSTMWRNNMTEVEDYLNSNYQGHYKVYLLIFSSDGWLAIICVRNVIIPNVKLLHLEVVMREFLFMIIMQPLWVFAPAKMIME